MDAKDFNPASALRYYCMSRVEPAPAGGNVITLGVLPFNAKLVDVIVTCTGYNTAAYDVQIRSQEGQVATATCGAEANQFVAMDARGRSPTPPAGYVRPALDQVPELNASAGSEFRAQINPADDPGEGSRVGVCLVFEPEA